MTKVFTGAAGLQGEGGEGGMGKEQLAQQHRELEKHVVWTLKESPE